MFSEPELWVAAAFVVFFALFGRRLWRVLAGRLDERSARIRAELEEAVRLREEAQNLLAGYQRRQREAGDEAEQILAHAREAAARLGEEAEARIGAQLAHRERLAEEKIAQAEARALDEIRAYMVDITVAAAAKVIADGLDKARDEALVDDAIARLEERLAR